MGFEKAFENKYNELDKATQYRFAEIELGKALHNLSNLFRAEYMPRQKAQLLLTKLLIQSQRQTNEVENLFFDTLNSNHTINPPKHEVIHYLIMKGHTYNKIRKLTKASFNTIAGMRFGIPQYYPIFPHWNDEMLFIWNDTKRALNIFDEELAHTKK